MLDLREEHGIPFETRHSPRVEGHRADSCRSTGTMGELAPVTTIDGMRNGGGTVGLCTDRLMALFGKLPARERTIVARQVP